MQPVNKIGRFSAETVAVYLFGNSLKPVKAAVEALCRRDANLLTADAILSFAMAQLQKQNTDLSTEAVRRFGKVYLTEAYAYVGCS